MINLNDRHRLHQFLMLELTIRYVKSDLAIIQTTKCTTFFTPVIEKLLNRLIQQHQREQRYFAKHQVKIIRWKRIDMYFSEVSVTTPGEDAVFTYANQAVKTHVEELLWNNWQALQEK